MRQGSSPPWRCLHTADASSQLCLRKRLGTEKPGADLLSGTERVRVKALTVHAQRNKPHPPQSFTWHHSPSSKTYRCPLNTSGTCNPHAHKRTIFQSNFLFKNWKINGEWECVIIWLKQRARSTPPVPLVSSQPWLYTLQLHCLSQEPLSVTQVLRPGMISELQRSQVRCTEPEIFKSKTEV